MNENLNDNPEKQISQDFEQAKCWLNKQDMGTKDLFRQKLISFLESKRGIKFDEIEFQKFKKIIESFEISEQTKEKAIKRLSEYMDEIFGSTRYLSEDGLMVKSFEQEIRDHQEFGLISKDLSPDDAQRNLVVILSNPNVDNITDLLTELKIATYPEYLLKVIYGKRPTSRDIGRSLKIADKKIKTAFLLGINSTELFSDKEKEEIMKILSDN